LRSFPGNGVVAGSVGILGTKYLNAISNRFPNLLSRLDPQNYIRPGQKNEEEEKQLVS